MILRRMGVSLRVALLLFILSRVITLLEGRCMDFGPVVCVGLQYCPVTINFTALLLYGTNESIIAFN